MKIYIHGGEIISTHGSIDSTWSALVALKQPSAQKISGHSSSYPLASVGNIKEPFGSAARLDVLLESLCQTIPEIPPDTALVCSTTKAAVDQLFQHDFPERGQLWHITSALEERLGVKQKGSCISAACASGTIAIIQAAMKIRAGECAHALVIGFDIMSEFIIGGFTSLKALSPTGSKPFDKDRDGLTLGEGAGWILLSKEPEPYGATKRFFSLADWGISCDATHITAPCRNATGLIRTLQQISNQNHPFPGGINAHGTGTSYNDAMELLAFASVYNSRPPVCSIKGSIGHCLGAAGVIEALISLKSLEMSSLPPTVGLTEPEEKASSNLSGKSTQPLLNPTVLSCNSGFGGINGAVLLAEEQI